MPEPLKAAVGTTIVSSRGVGVNVEGSDVGANVGAEGAEVGDGLGPQALSIARTKKVTNGNSRVDLFISNSKFMRPSGCELSGRGSVLHTLI